MMFVCRLDSDFDVGVGDTPMEAFEDMIQMIRVNDGDDMAEGIEPMNCQFFEQIEVNIRETKTWSIEPQYEFVDD